MTSLSPSVAPDNFTWSRVWSVMRLIAPRVRNLTIVYVAICIAVAVLVLLGRLVGFPIGSIGLFSVIPCIMFYVAPAFLLNATDTLQFQLIPAKVSEKFVAIVIYSIVLNYLIVSISSIPVAVTVLDNEATSSIQTIMKAKFGSSWVGLNQLSGLLAPIVCMYVSIASPGRKWQAVGAAFLVCVVEGLVGGIYGICMTTRCVGLFDGEPDVDLIVETILSGVAPFMLATMVVCVLLSVLFMVLAYRKLASRQI
ncbi:MAG: hypothetical protein K2K40_01545 [Paramuribaculum sp.]|nr:hypothetical protein [Paramuribaculum sp.]